MFFFQKNSTSFDTVVTSHYFEFNPSQPSWRNFDIATCVRQQKRLFLKFTVNGGTSMHNFVDFDESNDLDKF